MVTLHTKYGIIIYANDFKLDNHPILGKKPDYKKLEDLSKKGILLLITDSLYSNVDAKTPSEKVAKEMLKDVLLGTRSQDNLIVVTTFSSHIARLKSIIEFGRTLNRKVVFLGRSLYKYVAAAEKVGLVNFSKEVELIGFRSLVKKKLKEIEKEGRNNYLIVCTGHQGEPDAILSRIANKKDINFDLLPNDIVVFSCKTIPTQMTIKNREELEKRLKQFHVRIFKDIHTSVLPDTEVVINNNKTMKIRKIGDIKENEKIKVPAFDHNAKIKWYDANLIKHYYSGKLFNIETKSGRNVTITEGHSLFRLKNGAIESIKGEDIKFGNYIAIPKKFSWRKELNKIDNLDYIKKDKYNPINHDKKWIYYGNIKICPRKIRLENNFAKVLGYYLAEGCAPRHILLVIGSHEKEIIKDFLKSAKKIFPSKFNLNKKVGKGIEITFGARILGRLFKTWFNSGAKNKKIPDFVFSANEGFKISFLGAYLNGDGCPENKNKGRRIRVKTASKKLASDLIYLFNQIGIFAKFDHIEFGKERFIAGNKKLTKETKSYVIRIQDKDSLFKLKRALCSRFNNLFINWEKTSQKYPPESLPLKELNLEEIQAKKNTGLKYYINCLKKGKKIKENHISKDILIRDSLKITGVTKKIINGYLAFDPVVDIKKYKYDGDVYDFKVPGVENFIGGFGGLMLHNSGHCSREDYRDLFLLLKPKNIIPAQCDKKTADGIKTLAEELGYKPNKTVHVSENNKIIKIS